MRIICTIKTPCPHMKTENGIDICMRNSWCEFQIVGNETEPRYHLDTESQCYGCLNYKKREDCIQDHIESDFDENDGACDISNICINGSANVNS